MSPWRLMIAGYCVAMAVVSRMVPLCPCCGDEVRIARIITAVVWCLVAGWALATRKRAFERFLVLAFLSAVQIGNFYTQYTHSYNDATLVAAWVVPAAALGTLGFLAMAIASRRRKATAS